VRQVPDRSSALPEDSLPDWVFRTEECEKCNGTIDEGKDYSEYGIEVCQCEEL